MATATRTGSPSALRCVASACLVRRVGACLQLVAGVTRLDWVSADSTKQACASPSSADSSGRAASFRLDAEFVQFIGSSYAFTVRYERTADYTYVLFDGLDHSCFNVDLTDNESGFNFRSKFDFRVLACLGSLRTSLVHTELPHLSPVSAGDSRP